MQEQLPRRRKRKYLALGCENPIEINLRDSETINMRALNNKLKPQQALYIEIINIPAIRRFVRFFGKSPFEQVRPAGFKP
jgi:hypothetical protein